MEKYRTFAPRFVALILDTVLLLPLAIVDDSIRNTEFSDQMKIALLTSLGFVNIAYFIIMHWKFGQTVGKMLMKIKVLDVSEEPLKFHQSVLRDLPQIIFLIGALFFVNATALKEIDTNSPEYWSNPFVILTTIWGFSDIITFFTNEKRRALHDYLAGSVVVRIKEPQDLPEEF